MDQNTFEVRVLLHNIRSAHNVGSIFRTSDAVGVSLVYLSGFTPRPIDKFLRPSKEIAKTALGAEKTIPWEYSESFIDIIMRSKAEGFVVVGIEQDARSVDFREFKSPEKVLIVLGSEVDGIANELRDHCDAIVEIPMKGKKESLNVAVAFGVAVFRLFLL